MSAGQGVVSGATAQRVVSCPTVECVVAGVAGEVIVEGAAGKVFDAAEDIATRTARRLRASNGKVLDSPDAGTFTLAGWSRPEVQIENPAAITEVGVIIDGSLTAGIQSPLGTLIMEPL